MDYDKISMMSSYEIDLYEILKAIGFITMAMATMILMTAKLSQIASSCQFLRWLQGGFFGIFMILYFLCRQ